MSLLVTADFASFTTSNLQEKKKKNSEDVFVTHVLR